VRPLVAGKSPVRDSVAPFSLSRSCCEEAACGARGVRGSLPPQPVTSSAAIAPIASGRRTIAAAYVAAGVGTLVVTCVVRRRLVGFRVTLEIVVATAGAGAGEQLR
jgi:hypothetical protein